jgi:hypothetical protein
MREDCGLDELGGNRICVKYLNSRYILEVETRLDDGIDKRC